MKRELSNLLRCAHEAGLKAGKEHNPTPMIITQRKNSFDDSSLVEKAWHVSQGVCGFAWIVIRPGNSALANAAKKRLGAGRGYYGGILVPVRGFGQSYERKMAYASAFAKVLNDAGYERVYADGRLD